MLRVLVCVLNVAYILKTDYGHASETGFFNSQINVNDYIGNHGSRCMALKLCEVLPFEQ